MKHQATEHEVTIISAEGTQYGIVEGNSIRVTANIDGDGFCMRCGLPLHQCLCKPRGKECE